MKRTAHSRRIISDKETMQALLRALGEEVDVSTYDLGARFGVSQSIVSRVLRAEGGYKKLRAWPEWAQMRQARTAKLSAMGKPGKANPVRRQQVTGAVIVKVINAAHEHAELSMSQIAGLVGTSKASTGRIIQAKGIYEPLRKRAEWQAMHEAREQAGSTRGGGKMHANRTDMRAYLADRDGVVLASKDGVPAEGSPVRQRVWPEHVGIGEAQRIAAAHVGQPMPRPEPQPEPERAHTLSVPEGPRQEAQEPLPEFSDTLKVHAPRLTSTEADPHVLAAIQSLLGMVGPEALGLRPINDDYNRKTLSLVNEAVEAAKLLQQCFQALADHLRS